MSHLSRPATSHDVCLDRSTLKGRSFILGNKRAFSLSLPAASGPSPTLLHAHKWFGAYLYGRKFLEGQAIRAGSAGSRMLHLGSGTQTGFRMERATAVREHEVEGVPVSESYFVPDGICGFACMLEGPLDFQIEPELDLRFCRALSESFAAYGCEQIDGGVLVWNDLPSGHFDDATETFLPGAPDSAEAVPAGRIFAAVQIVGEAWEAQLLPGSRRIRRVTFRKDQQRQRFLSHSGDDASDHAPLWNRGHSHVYVPVRLRAHGPATVVYGFGGTREEAMEALHEIRVNCAALQEQKVEAATALLQDAAFECGSSRVDTAYEQVYNRLMDALVVSNAIAADTALHAPATMILAGNQYFHDCWKRDENIALGALLATGRYELARDVIDHTWQLQDAMTGRLPQRIRPGEDPPYHSSDGTLWALLRLHQYWRSTGDDALLDVKLPMAETFFRRSLARVQDGLLPSGRTAAPDYLWETWMDTPHTPRHGFPVEIQMLWIACLRAFRPLVGVSSPELESAMAAAEASAWHALARFNLRGMPADSLDEKGEPRDLITPNPYFCFGVGLDLGPEIENVMRRVGRSQLAGRHGILTLAPQDWPRVFLPEFLGDRRNVRGRRMRSAGKLNYHRGVEWNWLSQFFVHAELKYGDADAAFRTYLERQVATALDHAGIGGISELFDLSGSRGPDFQAWSMAGFVESLHAFAGVRIDVPERRIIVEPQLPSSWPYLKLRKWYAGFPFELRFARDDTRYAVDISFPQGKPPDAEIEVAVVLLPFCSPRHAEAVIDGVRHQLSWRTERMPGTRRTRVRFSLPARQRIEIAVDVQRSVSRRPALTQAG